MKRTRRAVRREGPLRVLFVVPHLSVGGAERHVVTLLERIDPHRFAGSLVCLQDGGVGTNWARLQASGVPGVEFHRERSDVRGMLMDLLSQMRRTRPDLVVLRGRNAEILGRVAAVLARVPRVVVWVHNCGDVEPHGPLRRVVDAALAIATDAAYGVAHAQVPYIVGDLGYPRTKVRIVHNGVDIDAFPEPTGERDRALAQELGIGDDEPVIGTVAVLRPEKDQRTLLRAFRRVVDVYPEARLLLVGDGWWERENLEALTDELGLRDRVLFLGHREDVAHLLRVFDVFTLSSRTVECFPVSLLEAMSAGLPAVCTDVGGIPEMIKDGVTGHTVAAQDPEALAEALMAVLADPARARAMGMAGRRRVREEFTLERSVAEAQEVMEETAGRVPRGRSAVASRR